MSYVTGVLALMQQHSIAELTLQKQTLQGKLLRQQPDFCHSLLSSMKGSFLVHGRCLEDVGAVSNLGCQTTMVVDQLGIDSIMLQAALLLPLDVVIPGVLGEAPAQPCDNVYLKIARLALHGADGPKFTQFCTCICKNAARSNRR